MGQAVTTLSVCILLCPQVADKLYLSNPATLAPPLDPTNRPRIEALSRVESSQRFAAARKDSALDQSQLNAVYSSLSMKRRYEVWFLRCGLADGSGAWWFRYLVMNPGAPRVDVAPTEMPAQVC